MFSRSAILGAGLLATVMTSAAPLQKRQAQFHEVHYYTDNMQSFSGTLVTPPRNPSGGTIYVWPGLQPPDNSGVLQPVLDGRDEHWYFGNAWVGNPSEPYGGGVDVAVNDVLNFNMVIGSGGSWTSTSSNTRTGASATYTFDISKTDMNQALFVVEQYSGSNWDFGNVVFKDVTITALGTDPSWCTSTPLYQMVTPTISGVSSSVSNGVVTCKIAYLELAP